MSKPCERCGVPSDVLTRCVYDEHKTGRRIMDGFWCGNCQIAFSAWQMEQIRKRDFPMVPDKSESRVLHPELAKDDFIDGCFTIDMNDTKPPRVKP